MKILKKASSWVFALTMMAAVSVQAQAPTTTTAPAPTAPAPTAAPAPTPAPTATPAPAPAPTPAPTVAPTPAPAAPAATAPATTAPGAGKILKIASLAPEGTTLAKGLIDMDREIQLKTGGAVKLQIYHGGQAGDEKDVVRKMRIGQLHGGALTGVGLGQIEPEIRVLELPFLFDTYQKADAVYAQMKPYFQQKFDQKGFNLLGWAEVGFVNIFSNKPVTNKNDLKGMKMWMWEGDPLAQAMYEAMGVVPVPLAITDVLTSLQTGLIDACYAPPLGAIAFQWHTKTKFVTDVNLVDATGGIVLTKQAWSTLTPTEQATVKAVIDAKAAALITQTRSDNAQSLNVLRSSGLQVVSLTPEALAELKTIGQQVQTKLVGSLYPQTLLDKVLALTK